MGRDVNQMDLFELVTVRNLCSIQKSLRHIVARNVDIATGLKLLGNPFATTQVTI